MENNCFSSSFTEWMLNQDKSIGTVKTYIEVIRKFKHWLETKGYSFKELEEEHIQLYINYLEEDKSPSTVEKHYAALNMYAKYLNNPNLMVNIVRHRTKPNNQKFNPPKTLDLAEESSFLSEVIKDGNLRNTSMIYLLLHTGIRVSELCNLNISDITMNVDHTTLSIKNNLGEIDRIIPLSQEAKKHLFNYMDSLTDQYMMRMLYTSHLNNRITPRAIQYILKKYGVTPHKLRHTFCQRLINSGVDIRTVSKLAGHKDLNITKRYVKDKELNLLDAIDMAFAN
jgi:integrase/recombinase XerD